MSNKTKSKNKLAPYLDAYRQMRAGLIKTRRGMGYVLEEPDQ